MNEDNELNTESNILSEDTRLNSVESNSPKLQNTNNENQLDTNSLEVNYGAENASKIEETITPQTSNNLNYKKPSLSKEFIGKPGTLYIVFGILVFLTGFFVSYGYFYILQFTVATILIYIGDIRYSSSKNLDSNKVNIKILMKSAYTISLTILVFIVSAFLFGIIVFLIPFLNEGPGGFFNTPNFYGNAIIYILATIFAMLFYKRRRDY